MNDAGSMVQTERLLPDEAGVERAAAILLRGGIVAFPTETVYGLGADANRPEAVARIYAAKERPRFNPLISHLPDLAAAQAQGLFDPVALALAHAFWPGPLTLVVQASPTCTISDFARAGLDTVGLRVPSHPLAHALLSKVGRPIAAPSANRSGRVSPTDSDHVLVDLDGRIDAILAGGATDVGVESTILACLDGKVHLLRPGGVTRESIMKVIGRDFDPPPGREAPLAPGMLASHYAPKARVRLNAFSIEPGEAALLFGGEDPAGIEHAAARIDLSPGGNLQEAAARLFSALRSLDAKNVPSIAVSPIPETGLGEAINDRLRRSAADR